MKVVINVATDEKDLDKLAKMGERSGLLRAGIHAVEKDPALISKTIQYLLDHPTKVEGKEKRSGVSVEMGDVNVLDQIARRIIATRNYAVQIIIKGILAGIIK